MVIAFNCQNEAVFWGHAKFVCMMDLFLALHLDTWMVNGMECVGQCAMSLPHAQFTKWKTCWSMITPNMSKHTCYIMTLHCNSRETATANDCMVCHQSLCTLSSFWTWTQKLLLHICVCQIVTSLNYGCKSKQVATNHQRHKQANNKMQTIKQANKQATAQHTNQPTLNNHSQWCNTANKPPNK